MPYREKAAFEFLVKLENALHTPADVICAKLLHLELLVQMGERQEACHLVEELIVGEKLKRENFNFYAE